MAQGEISTPTIWTIKNFTKLSDEMVYSDEFAVGGYRWRLFACPKLYGHLSLFLAVDGHSTFVEGLSLDIESCSITVVNQVHAKDSIEKTVTQDRFVAPSSFYSFLSFMRLSNLSDPAKGYLVNDTLVVEARVSVSTEYSSNLLKKTKNLLTELSSMNGATPGSEISPPNSQFLQQQRKALEDYLVLSVESIKRTTAFDEFERLVPQCCLETFKETVLPAMKSSIENVKAQLISLSGKCADVGARLEHGQEQLCFLYAKFSKLSEEESSLEAEILRLTAQKQQRIFQKKFMVLELEKIDVERTSIDLAEWRDIIKETEGIDEHWLQTREKLVQDNLSFKPKLEPSQDSE